MEASKAKFQSFAGEQRQLEPLSIRKGPGVGDIKAYLWYQTGFQSRRHMYRVNSVLL